ncbi:MAG TPA: thioredoxin domain-containing protein [Acidobacteriaceae bacterium]|nr:thioredoxin domain-containing protein [Acidobacteriaceae bacterium]
MPKNFLALVCALSMAAGMCAAQQASATTPQPSDTAAQALSASLSRKVEIMIRSELGVPPEYNIAIGPRGKSNVAGYDRIAVTFSLPDEPNRAQTLDFLLSKDGNTLARLSKWDIANDPMAGLPITGRPVRGNVDAKVTIVNFDDLECPFCAKLNTEFFPDTINHYKGLVKFIYVDYPLTTIHPWAMHAAVNANCLAAQSGTAYWNYVDYLHTNGAEVSGSDNDPAKAAARLDHLAEQEGVRDHLDSARLEACVAKQDDSQIRAEMTAGDKLGVDSTPTFFVNGERWSGVLDESQLWIMIDRALREQGITPPPAEAPAAAGGAGTGQGQGDGSGGE